MEEAPLLVFLFGRRVPRSFVAVRTCVGLTVRAETKRNRHRKTHTHTTLGLSQGTAQGDGTSCTLDLFFRCNCFYNCLNCFKLF